MLLLVISGVIAGVPVRIVEPKQQDPKRSGEVLINIHGGGFVADWGSLTDCRGCGKANRRDPVVSPIYADLHGFPPTLFLSSTRDMLLSDTAMLQRAFLRAGVPTQFVVFEALEHGFWNDPSLPESREADRTIAKFFEDRLDSDQLGNHQP